MSDAIIPRSPPVVLDARGATDHLPMVRAVAKLMDTAFVVPGTRFRFGLDALIDLIPGVGDAVGAAVSTYLVYAAAQMGVPKAVLARMLLNVGIDAAIGIVPFAGAVGDAVWKANVRNAALLERAVAEPRAARRSSVWLFAGLAAVVLALAAGGVVLSVLLVKWVWNAV